MRHNAKCCADWSNRCRDIVIFKFLGCRPPPSWISLNFKFVTDETITVTASPCQISLKSLQLLPKYGDFSIFQNGGRRHVEFLKLQISNCMWAASQVSNCAKFRGDRSNRCRDISILDFSRWRQPLSWIFKILNF